MSATSLPTITSLAADLVEGRTGVVLRSEIVEPVVAAIIARHRRGWATARIALWMGSLPDLAGHPVAQPWFIAYVTDLLRRPASAPAAELLAT